MSKYVKNHISNLERIRPMQNRIDYIRLDMNENPAGLPKDFFSKVISKLTPEMISMYPEPSRLESLLCKKHDVTNENIIITNGSDEAIKSIFEIFSKEGSKFISVYPTFEMYMVYAKMFNLEISTINYSDDMNISIEKIVQEIDENTSIIALLNPNNPIGTVYTSDEVERVITKANSVGAIVIIDEAYHYFYDRSFINLIEKYDNIIVTRTFSKACSIAGLRIGYAVGSKAIISSLEKIRQTFNVNTVSLLFAEEILLENGLIDRLVEIELEGRNFILEKLEKSGRKTYAQNGNYVFFKPLTNKIDVIEKLKENKVLVRGYSVPILEDYIRISTGSKEIMEKFWNILQIVDEGKT